MFFCFIAFVEIHMNNYVLIFYAFYIRAYIHTYIYTHTHASLHACEKTCTHTHIYTQTPTQKKQSSLFIWLRRKEFTGC